jgi:hypothetical protein
MGCVGMIETYGVVLEVEYVVVFDEDLVRIRIGGLKGWVKLLCLNDRANRIVEFVIDKCDMFGRKTNHNAGVGGIVDYVVLYCDLFGHRNVKSASFDYVATT